MASSETDVEKQIPPATYGTEQPAPPSYDQVNKDAPPSYLSIYGDIKNARAGSSGLADFLMKMITILLNTLCCTIIMGFILAIPVTMIILGAVYKDECAAQKYIPIYLIVGGSFTLVKNLLDLCTRFLKRGEEGTEEGQTKQSALSNLIGCFLLGWFIAGNVWVYGANFVTDDSNADNYCNPTLYYFTFWLITSTYILGGLICCCICCAACATSTADSA